MEDSVKDTAWGLLAGTGKRDWRKETRLSSLSQHWFTCLHSELQMTPFETFLRYVCVFVGRVGCGELHVNAPFSSIREPLLLHLLLLSLQQDTPASIPSHWLLGSCFGASFPVKTQAYGSSSPEEIPWLIPLSGGSVGCTLSPPHCLQFSPGPS